MSKDTSKVLEGASGFSKFVIANLVDDFEEEGADETPLQELKHMCVSKMETISEADPSTPIPDVANNSGSTVTKKDAAEAPTTFSVELKSSVKGGPVPVQQALSNVVASSPSAAVAAASPLTIKWQANQVPQILRVPQRSARPDWQMDGVLAPIEEEDGSDEKNEKPKAELEHSDDGGPPLNSGDDLSDEDTIKEDNIILAQYVNVKRIGNNWEFEFTNGVMHINGKDYVFKECNGQVVCSEAAGLDQQ